MGVLFQVRGTQMDAWFSRGGKTPGIVYESGEDEPAPAALGDPSVLGGSAIKLIDSNAQTQVNLLAYPGRKNFRQTLGDWSVLFRIVPNWTGNPATSQSLGTIGESSGTLALLRFWIDTASKLRIDCQNRALLNNFVYGGTPAMAFTAGVATDILITYTHATKTWSLYQDGALSASFVRDQFLDGDFLNYTGISLGGHRNIVNVAGTNYHLNEFVIWDDVIVPAYPRADFIEAANFDGDAYTDPGTGNVKTGIGYTHAGVAQVGTYDGSDRWSDPGEANVRLGVGYQANAAAKVGALESTDPGVANVSTGVAYKINSVAKVGTREAVTNIMSEAQLEGAL